MDAHLTSIVAALEDVAFVELTCGTCCAEFARMA